MTIYEVLHHFDKDGGCGDAIGGVEVVGRFTKLEDAKKFVAKYENKHVYFTPYADLYCGELTINEAKIYDSFEEFPEMEWQPVGWYAPDNLVVKEVK